MAKGISQTDIGLLNGGEIVIDPTPPAIPAPIASGTFNPPDSTVDAGYTYETAPLFTGGAPTSYLLNGTLPDGLVFSSVTGAISGVPTTEQTSSGISVSGINGSGSDTTNTADITINAASVPTGNYSIAEINVDSIGQPVGFTYSSGYSSPPSPPDRER